jgi:hypothetical protein
MLEVLLGILPPEMVPLRVGIPSMSERDAEDLLHDLAVFEGNRTQAGPILALAAVDYIVQGSQRVLLMIQMAMQHGLPFPKTSAHVQTNCKTLKNGPLSACIPDAVSRVPW